MGLDEFRKKFFALRGQNKVQVKKHAWRDHPKRNFTEIEILNIVRGIGQIRPNVAATALPGSFVFHAKDDDDADCEIVVLIEEVAISGHPQGASEWIIICSAYRQDKV